ncbi:endo alpha-1,4 polygalactosaminidase, partial [Streptomyces boncukensis]|uniref:endo alpha-1,4 polygalactosaminidase n=1 Tax=Streptomyces boncukensis TaxID=2711219 RepID=UPI0030BA006E
MATDDTAGRTAPAPPHRPRPPLRAVSLLVPLALLLAGCASSDGGSGGSARAVRKPPAGAPFDYQLSAPYRPSKGVRVLSRDRVARPASGRYTVCYVNAFQSQPGKRAARWWEDTHPDLLLRDGRGKPVVDEDWNEPLLDISSGTKRKRLIRIVGRWIDGCAERGFDAVEPDNLDSYERSHGLLDTGDAAAFARLLARRAHAGGLAIAQKNTADLLKEHRRIGFDFAVTEECARYRECGRYARAYEGRVFDVEYRERDFTR